MGLKSGSRDAGLDESEEEDDQPQEDESPAVDALDEEPGRVEDRETERRQEEPSTSEATDASTESSQRPTMSSIPYKLRREKVNEGREQVPYFLREEIIDAEDNLQNELEELLGEDVYKSDYREAAMVVAQRNPELVAEVLREWGYDLDSA